MKQVFLSAGAVRVEEVSAPVCPPNGVLVRVAYSLISAGTEMAAVGGGAPSPPRAALDRYAALLSKVRASAGEVGWAETARLIQRKLARGGATDLNAVGYSAAGTVAEVGPLVTDINAGAVVACAGAGVANHAELIAVPKNLFVTLPAGVDARAGAFTTLGAIAMQGVRRAQVSFGETVVISGLGLLGLLAVQIAKAAGLRVIGIDLLPERLALARQLGADVTAHVGQDDVARIVQQETQQAGADAAIIYAAAKSDEPVLQAMRLCRRKGRVVIVGDIGLGLQREAMYAKELDLVISTSYGPGRYDPVYEEDGLEYPLAYVRWSENRNMQAFVQMLASGVVQVDPLITHTFPVADAPRAYAALRAPEARALGVLLEYPQTAAPAVARVQARPPRPVASGPIRLAVIGAGGFAQGMHLPNLKRSSEFALRAVVCRRSAQASTVARQFGVPIAVTDYREVLADPEVDAVLIATRHHLHAPLAIEAARAGKAILLEKPMALNEEELGALVAAVADTGVVFSVGFNRRYAPTAVRLKEMLAGCRPPFFLQYRVNAGFIPPDSWLHDPAEGGGRIIGEGCHFFDLFNYLVGTGVVEVMSTTMPPDGGSVVAPDNCVATLRYAGGSVATLSYVALGAPTLPKERLEVFAPGKVFVLDDFRSLTAYGEAAPSDALTGAQDKGHAQELAEFARAVRGTPSLLASLEECVRATRISFEVEGQRRTVG